MASSSRFFLESLPLITKYKQALATLVELDENEEEELKEDQEEAGSFWP